MILNASVIIPVYNDALCLDDCLASLVALSDHEFDVVVVDDGSTDDPLLIAEKYSCQTLRLNKNHGPSYARNCGVRLSKGDVLLFLDADATVGKNWVYDFTQELVRSHQDDPSIVAVGGRIDSGTGFMEKCHSHAGYGYVQGGKRRFMSHLNAGCVAILKSAYWEVGGFAEDMRVSEDPDLAYRLIHQGYRIVFEPRLSIYHDHGVKTFSQLLKKHSHWGRVLGLTLEMKHPHRVGGLGLLLRNPVTHFMSIVPIAFLTTCKLICHNVRGDPKILAYSVLIFISKIYYRWGIFRSWSKEKTLCHTMLS